jgi:hypothetical protein
MIKAIYITDFNGVILIERCYEAKSNRDLIKKLVQNSIVPAFSLKNTSTSTLPTIASQTVYEIDSIYVCAISRDQVIILATIEEDVTFCKIIQNRHFYPKYTRYWIDLNVYLRLR